MDRKTDSASEKRIKVYTMIIEVYGYAAIVLAIISLVLSLAPQHPELHRAGGWLFVGAILWIPTLLFFTDRIHDELGIYSY